VQLTTAIRGHSRALSVIRFAWSAAPIRVIGRLPKLTRVRSSSPAPATPRQITPVSAALVFPDMTQIVHVPGGSSAVAKASAQVLEKLRRIRGPVHQHGRHQDGSPRLPVGLRASPTIVPVADAASSAALPGRRSAIGVLPTLDAVTARKGRGSYQQDGQNQERC
jgi:hypothetical protein